jgi:glycosyltransferase involved in cell wall biosynthesis
MDAPKISICIPAYRQTDYLKRTLDSIAIQEFLNYEIILTDDSPDDSVKNLLNAYSFGGKLKYFKNRIRLGSPENWNEAIKHASGSYIKILHHDDWFTSSSSLSKFAALLDAHPESDFAFSATSVYNSKNGTYTVHQPEANQLVALKADPPLVFFGNFIGAPSATIYRKSAILPYDKAIKFVVDMDFYIRMLNHNPNFQYSQETLICTTSEAVHQVTDGCMQKDVQLFEYTYLYNKLRKTYLPEKRFGNYFYTLFNQFDVKSLKELKASGIPVPEPKFYFQWMLFKRRMKAMLKK